MPHPPPPLTSTTLKTQHGAVASFHITSPLNIDHRIFVSLDNPRLVVLDSQGQNEKSVDITTEGTIWSIASWEDKWLVVGGTNGELSVLDLKSLTKSHTLTGHTSTIRAIKALSPTTLISSSRDTTIRMWDISSTNPTCTAILEGHTATIRCLSIQGNHLVSGAYENDVQIWDLGSTECMHVLKGHTDKIYAVASAEGIVVTGSMDCTARVWDLHSGVPLATLPGQNLVSHIHILPDLILTGDNNGTLQIWSQATYAKLHELKAHQSAIVSMECDAFGQKLATGSSDGSVKVWDMRSGLLVKELVKSDVTWSVGWVDGKVVAVILRDRRVVVETWEDPASLLKDSTDG